MLQGIFVPVKGNGFSKIGFVAWGALWPMGLPLPFIPPCSFLGWRTEVCANVARLGKYIFILHLVRDGLDRTIRCFWAARFTQLRWCVLFLAELSWKYMEVENGHTWKGTTIGGAYFSTSMIMGEKGMVWKEIWYLLLAMIFSCVNCNDRFTPTSGFPRCSYLVTVIL